jgi:undecaprenyl-phosphate 4-deoxy-4-formamido-L-arabinose transferase
MEPFGRHILKTFSSSESKKMKTSLTCSIVVPVYNGAESIPALVERLDKVLPDVAGKYEVILVNDGSRDQSWDRIIELSNQYSWITGMNLARNYGQHNALLCGIRQAQYEYIVTMDDDLQNPPEEIPGLLAKLAEGYDAVYGTPEREQHGLWRNLASQMTKLALQGAMGVETARKVSAFRAFRAHVRDTFTSYHGYSVNIDVLLTWGTNRFTFIPVRHDPRHSGNSHYSLGKLILHGLNMLTGFSTLPLQLASITGFAFMFFGIGVLVYVIGRYAILGYSVPGFPFLASIIAIFSGAQLFALGIIGEYLARMYFQIMDRPPYALRSKVDHGIES